MPGAQSAVAALLALAGLLQLADVATTARALARGRREANPLVGAMMRRAGRLWWLPKLAVTGAGMALIWLGRGSALALPAAAALALVTGVAVVVNWRRGRAGRR